MGSPSQDDLKILTSTPNSQAIYWTDYFPEGVCSSLDESGGSLKSGLDEGIDNTLLTDAVFVPCLASSLACNGALHVLDDTRACLSMSRMLSGLNEQRTKALLIGICYRRRNVPTSAETASSISGHTILAESYETSALTSTSYANTIYVGERLSWVALDGPWRDIESIESYLRKNCPYREVRKLSDEMEPGQVSRENIITQLKWLVEGAQEGDRLLLHYSGHGYQRPTRSSTEDDFFDETIVPEDCPYPDALDGKVKEECPVDCQCPPGATYCWKRSYNGMIRDNELRDLLVKSLPKGVKLLAMFDCCHSGTMVDLQYQYKHRPNRKKNRLPSKPSSSPTLSLLAAVALEAGVGSPTGSGDLSPGSPPHFFSDRPLCTTPIDDSPPKLGLHRRLSQAMHERHSEYQKADAGGRVMVISACCDDQEIFELKNQHENYPTYYTTSGLLTFSLLQVLNRTPQPRRHQLIKEMTEIFKVKHRERIEQLKREQIAYNNHYAEYQRALASNQSYPTDVLTAEYQKYMDYEKALKSSKLSVPILSSNYDIKLNGTFKL
ncbi:hypothetical protein PIIN_04140 [Serendipita indica DSM 11827]|uniref:Peptidase C14 caspase domain-containing protein n=1 Tax=Serendipita indica (strain DSM 11827) TaxID=1109443 RepID=G4TFV6_SERID|nr:hypothetical protein PIIN_04140 [Serendipita indica DSM 11827]